MSEMTCDQVEDLLPEILDGNLEQFVDNVGEVESSGAELELSWAPGVSGLLMGLNVGYLDVEVNFTC